MNKKDFIQESAMRNAAALLSKGETDLTAIITRSTAVAINLHGFLEKAGFTEKE